MLTRLYEESLAREHLRDLRRIAAMEALHAEQRRLLAEPVPRPTREAAPWITAAFPVRGRRALPALEVSCESSLMN
jgi:hypothetical protein